MPHLLRDRRVLLSVAAIGGLVAVALWPRAAVVDLESVARGPLVVTVDEEGRTRVRDRFVVTAPVTGRVQRIELDPGDRVAAGDVVARLHAESPALLDARSRAEAVAALDAATGALGRARAEAQRAQAARAQAERELLRSRTLNAAGATARQEVETREAELALAEQAARAAAFAADAAAADVARARARSASVATVAQGRGGGIAVRAPVAGVVLKRLRESEGVVPAGDPLVEIGDAHRIEIVADLLSTDAVRVRPGARAIIEQWGGDTPLAAMVRRVEPAGFTKVSALGVEEQRVNVVLDLADAESCALLGDAYRVETRIVLWEHGDVLKVPTGALFRHDGEWAVYVASNGRARLTPVTLGHQTASEAEVTSGLSEGALVIAHPGDAVRDGVRLRRRS